MTATIHLNPDKLYEVTSPSGRCIGCYKYLSDAIKAAEEAGYKPAISETFNWTFLWTR